MGEVGVDDLEDLRALGLAEHDRAQLIDEQTECTFVFSGEGGWPSGVVMSYVRHGGAFWLTAVRQRAHARALQRDPRVTLVISNAGTDLPGRRMLSVRGVGTVHSDRATKEWFFARFCARFAPGDPAAFTRLLDSPSRVVFQVRPVAVAVSHDSRGLTGNGRGGGEEHAPQAPSVTAHGPPALESTELLNDDNP